MPHSIQRIKGKRSSETDHTDVTDAVEADTVSATPHPDPEIDRPRSYSVTLTLTPQATALADELREALLDMDPARMVVDLEGADVPIEDLPVSVSKAPHLGTQNTAELGAPPRAPTSSTSTSSDVSPVPRGACTGPP